MRERSLARAAQPCTFAQEHRRAFMATSPMARLALGTVGRVGRGEIRASRRGRCHSAKARHSERFARRGKNFFRFVAEKG
jgi:hypothetical protein